jgi:tetratricopeptide (TPR) repeat protein
VVVANAIRVLLPDLIHDRPADIRDLAALSLELLEDTRGRWPRTWLDIAADLEAHAGNACRLLSDPRAARRRFAHAIALAAESPDDLVQARVGHLTSVYLRDARRFETADQLAEFARAIYEEVESHEEAGRVEFLQATIPYYRGDLETAVRKLLALREKVLDTITRLSVTNLLSRSYVLLGPSFKAVKLLPEVQELARCFTSPSIQVYIDWLKGLILGHAGQTEPAGRLLSKVEHLFLEQGKLTESALVVLDRADLYARIGRHREAAEAARSVIGAFEVTEKHQEALAALRLYVEADRSAKEQIGKELRLYLPLAQADPGFKYRPGCIIG